MEIPHDGFGAACEHGSVTRVVWSVREGKAGELDAPELAAGYRSTHPVHEPKIGEVLELPDVELIGEWREVDLPHDAEPTLTSSTGAGKRPRRPDPGRLSTGQTSPYGRVPSEGWRRTGG